MKIRFLLSPELTTKSPVEMALSITPDWLRGLCSWLWVVPALASILSAMIAFGAQRDRRDEQSVDERFNDEFSKMCDAMEKNPASARANPQWREIHSERHRCARKTAEACRWESTCLFWMIATGCALAAVGMLYASSP